MELNKNELDKNDLDTLDSEPDTEAEEYSKEDLDEENVTGEKLEIVNEQTGMKIGLCSQSETMDSLLSYSLWIKENFFNGNKKEPKSYTG